ncbi:MAG TPA: putative sulfate exporter family transporter [Ornithinicoccus sp.]|nr:putative sulfate exporter family transporter [Ornithinicoccus sp.]
MTRRTTILPGLALSTGLGLVAYLLGRQVPVIGGPVLGILLGLAVGTWLGPWPALTPGTAFAAKKVLQTAVVLLGFGLSLTQVARIGWETLPVMLGTLVLALAAGPLIGRWLGVAEDIRTLVTVGTGICGASAIATVSAVTGATGVAVAVSVAVIFVYNALAVVLFPLLGHALGLSQEGFGLWAGTAVNDTSSVVAAATVYGAAATSHAVVVKLTRTLMIIPIAVGHSVARGRQVPHGQAGMPWRRLVPLFLVLFLLAAAANSIGVVPDSWSDPVRQAAAYLTTVALTAIGLSTPVRAVQQAGWRPLALGGVLWVLVAVSSLVLMRLTGHW